MYEEHSVAEMLGKTMESVEQDGVESITFRATDGWTYTLFHSQDCCESVEIEDVCGDLQALVGSPIIMAEESSSNEQPADLPNPAYEPESQTWTFYKFATAKGYVTVRWYGESNGYYSESVSLVVVNGGASGTPPGGAPDGLQGPPSPEGG